MAALLCQWFYTFPSLPPTDPAVAPPVAVEAAAAVADGDAGDGDDPEFVADGERLMVGGGVLPLDLVVLMHVCRVLISSSVVGFTKTSSNRLGTDDWRTTAALFLDRQPPPP